VDISEQELQAAIGKVLSGAGPEVAVGVGDDAAVVEAGAGHLVITTDVLVEGSHFRRATTSARDLGYKAVVVNVSDIAAVAASPRYAVCALTLSDDVDAAWTMELFGGMREACDEYALWLVGGNLARGPEISVAITVTGEVARGRAVLRSEASPGERLVVTGGLGAAAAGLRVATDGRVSSDEDRALLRAYFRPVARVGEGGVLARHGATSMIDVSDGLALDLWRVCMASGVGARLLLDRIPIAPGATEDEAMGGGEDYELLATLPGNNGVAAAGEELRDTFGVALTDIGETTEAPSIVAVANDTIERPLDPRGWDHFARR
jgi:thiamine-monophosphate kinase